MDEVKKAELSAKACEITRDFLGTVNMQSTVESRHAMAEEIIRLNELLLTERENHKALITDMRKQLARSEERHRDAVNLLSDQIEGLKRQIR